MKFLNTNQLTFDMNFMKNPEREGNDEYKHDNVNGNKNENENIPRKVICCCPKVSDKQMNSSNSKKKYSILCCCSESNISDKNSINQNQNEHQNDNKNNKNFMKIMKILKIKEFMEKEIINAHEGSFIDESANNLNLNDEININNEELLNEGNVSINNCQNHSKTTKNINFSIKPSIVDFPKSMNVRYDSINGRINSKDIQDQNVSIEYDDLDSIMEIQTEVVHSPKNYILHIESLKDREISLIQNYTSLNNSKEHYFLNDQYVHKGKGILQGNINLNEKRQKNCKDNSSFSKRIEIIQPNKKSTENYSNSYNVEKNDGNISNNFHMQHSNYSQLNINRSKSPDFLYSQKSFQNRNPFLTLNQSSFNMQSSIQSTSKIGYINPIIYQAFIPLIPNLSLITSICPLTILPQYTYLNNVNSIISPKYGRRGVSLTNTIKKRNESLDEIKPNSKINSNNMNKKLIDFSSLFPEINNDKESICDKISNSLKDPSKTKNQLTHLNNSNSVSNINHIRQNYSSENLKPVNVIKKDKEFSYTYYSLEGNKNYDDINHIINIPYSKNEYCFQNLNSKLKKNDLVLDLNFKNIKDSVLPSSSINNRNKIHDEKINKIGVKKINQDKDSDHAIEGLSEVKTKNYSRKMEKLMSIYKKKIISPVKRKANSIFTKHAEDKSKNTLELRAFLNSCNHKFENKSKELALSKEDNSNKIINNVNISKQQLTNVKLLEKFKKMKNYGDKIRSKFIKKIKI